MRFRRVTNSSPTGHQRLLDNRQKLNRERHPKCVLFVDDESALRLTVPPILTDAGFHVTVAATVPDALREMTLHAFDVLISDLNIGEPGDGFTVVSAMRRCQPRCRTLILTGYPDFDAALEAIRQQVDGFVTKPTHPDRLIATVQQQLAPRRQRHGHERLASLLRRNRQSLIQSWLDSVEKDSTLKQVEMPQSERIDHIPVLLDELIRILESKIHAVGDHSRVLNNDLQLLDHVQERTIRSAAQHGAMRRRQGYRLEMLFRESRLAQAVIFQAMHEHLLELELSWVIPDLTVVSDVIDVLVAKSVETFSEKNAA
jgi:DNA-binding response OmpR family regulator